MDNKLVWHTKPPDGWEIVVGRYDYVGANGEVNESEYVYKVLVYDPSEHVLYKWSDGNYGSCRQPNTWCDADEFVRIMVELMLMKGK